jgi:parallel beta-helix repeat protein
VLKQKKMKKSKTTNKSLTFIFFAILSFLSLNAMAKDYYISNSGNDNANGLSPGKSFRTIEKLNSIQLRPGDNIYFKSGEIFTGTLNLKHSGSEGKPIKIAVFGGEDKAILSGSRPIHDIKDLGNNLYEAPFEHETKYFYLDGSLLTIAREPDKGYFTMDGGGIDYLVDLQQDLNPGVVVGSTVRMRVTNWNYEYREAVAFKEFKIKFDSMLYNTAFKNYSCEKGYGYYLDNKKEFLDANNESYWSPGEKKVYFISSGFTENSELRGSVDNKGIVIAEGVSHIHIGDLIIDGFIEYGILSKGNNKHILVADCVVRNIVQMGFHAETGCDYINLANNEFHDIYGTGIRLKAPGYSTIINNKVEKVGLVPGYGVDGINGAIGISIENIPVLGLPPDQLTNNNLIQQNYVDSTGYMSVRMDGYHNVFEKNIVKNGLLTMNDGGLIHTYGEDTRDGINLTYTHSNIIRDNIFMNCYGNTESSSSDHKIIHGIYLDARSNKFTIENNLVVNCGGGILLNDKTRDCTVRHNVLYGNNYAAGLSIVQAEKFDSLNHWVTKNILFNTQNRKSTLSLINNRGTRINPGYLDSNMFVSPSEKFHIKEITVDKEWKNTREYTLEGWMVAYGNKKNVFFTAEKNGEEFQRNEIFINDSNEPKTIELNPRFEYIDLGKKNLTAKIVLPPRGHKIVFYRSKD